MKRIYVFIFALLFSCTGNTGADDDYKMQEQLLSIDYDEFRDMSFLWRIGMFRGIAGRMNDVPFAVGILRRNHK